MSLRVRILIAVIQTSSTYMRKVPISVLANVYACEIWFFIFMHVNCVSLPSPPITIL